jgi:hypothetical protein
VTLVEQSILRAPDGTRWVVSTVAEGADLLTTARRTGCDLTPAATTRSTTSAAAAAAHRAYRASIARHGRPGAPPGG